VFATIAWTNIGGEHDKIDFHTAVGFGGSVRQCWEFIGAGEASADAHCGLSVRQLSVQHSEGREPSRLRTKVEGD
jgi:hypothetical protein